MGQLDGKVVVITGSGRGQGQAAARLFAQEGAHVVVNDLDEESVNGTVREIRSAGGKAEAAVGDVSNGEDVQRVLGAAERLGGLDVLYNNAGIGYSAPRRFGVGMATVTECTEEDWSRVIAINLTGVFLNCKYGIPLLVARGGGVVINTASIGAIRGMQDAHAYSAAKGGVISLTRSIAATYGPQGIRCNAILPGAIDTDMVHHVIEPEDVWNSIVASTPVRRVGRPEDIARAALWLASDASAFVTGQEIVVDGGVTA